MREPEKQKKGTDLFFAKRKANLSPFCFPLLVLAFVLLSFFQISSAQENRPPLRTPISSAAEVDYPPFCFIDAEGRATGFSIELMRAAVNAMGRDVTFRKGTWSDVKGWLEQGEVQALPLVGRTSERESFFDFTFPYMLLHGAIVVREGTADIFNLEDLRGRKVAVMKADNAEEFLRREDRGMEITTTATSEEALRQLSEGLYDAVVIQRLVALRLIQEHGFTNLHVVNQPIDGFRQDFCFAVKEGDRDTLALLNEGLALVMADGTYRHLHAKWFAAMELPQRRIVIGGDHNYPPYEFLNEKGRPDGYNVELTRAIARAMGLDVEIRLGPWAEILKALESGQVDAMQGMFYSPERDRTLNFSQAHTMNQYVSVVRRGTGPPPASLADLADRRIIVQDRDVIQDFLESHGLGEQLILAETQEEVLRGVAAGKGDCGLVVRISALHFMQKHGWKDLTLGRHAFLTAEYCYAAPENRKALLTQLGEGLEMIRQSGEYRRIHEKWLGVYEQGPLRLLVVLRYLALVAGPLLLLLLAFFLWSWSLRKQVARRTSELKKSEMLLTAIIESIAAPVFYKDTKGVYLGCNQAFSKFIGLPKESIIGATAFDLTSKELAQRYFEADQALLREEKTQIYESEVLDGKGSPRRVIFHKALFRAPDGVVEGIAGAMVDITDLKLAQERIEHLNRVLRAIREVNQLIVRERDRDTLIHEGCRLLADSRGYAWALIILTDEDDRPVFWAESGMEEGSRKLVAMLEEGRLPPCTQRVWPEPRVLVTDDREDLCGGCPIGAECAGIQSMCVALAHDGKRFGYLLATLDERIGVDEEEQSLFAEMAGDLAYALRMFEVEEARERIERAHDSMQSQMLQAQKMESIGRLAGGVAHDYNNMLSVILGYAEMATGRVRPDDPLYADLQEIRKAANRSAEITRQLLAFARKQTVKPEILNLNETVEGMLRMLRRLIGEDITLVWLGGSKIWPVKMDPVQLDQVLANLCINARDAIAGVGSITIETENVTLDEVYCTEYVDASPGDYLVLTVGDTGSGMDRETLDRIFEPFFTTKGVGKGTGLGLPTVYGIVRQNNGFIHVYSEPGEGSTFRIYLPRYVGDDAQGGRPGADQGRVPQGRGETVLLVEDDPGMRKMAETMLQSLGYRVLAAESSDDAIRLVREHPGGIELLITDVVMPDMNGRQLAGKLLEIEPDLKCLFMSGYTANVIAHHGVLDKDVHFIEKPFSIKVIAEKIREIL